MKGGFIALRIFPTGANLNSCPRYITQPVSNALFMKLDSYVVIVDFFNLERDLSVVCLTLLLWWKQCHGTDDSV